MVVMIGLAVGIDYSLLVVSRFKEELARGRPPHEAVGRAGATAGRTVVFSGATVVLALVGLLITPASFYQSLALGAILVVIFAMLATLTLLPAALALLRPTELSGHPAGRGTPLVPHSAALPALRSPVPEAAGQAEQLHGLHLTPPGIRL